MDFITDHSRSIRAKITASGEKVIGKVNRPKTSVNLTIGTNKNSDTWFQGLRA